MTDGGRRKSVPVFFWHQPAINIAMAAVYVHYESGWRVDDVSVNMERQLTNRSVLTPSGSWQLAYDAADTDASLVAYVLCDGVAAQFVVGNSSPANENTAYVVLSGERFAFYIPNGHNLYYRNVP